VNGISIHSRSSLIKDNGHQLSNRSIVLGIILVLSYYLVVTALIKLLAFQTTVLIVIGHGIIPRVVVPYVVTLYIVCGIASGLYLWHNRWHFYNRRTLLAILAYVALSSVYALVSALNVGVMNKCLCMADMLRIRDSYVIDIVLVLVLLVLLWNIRRLAS